MKRYALLFVYLFPSIALAKFIHPMDFDGSDAQKQEVIDYIQTKVKENYCEGPIDMCQESMLRMMEKQNLKAFKQASEATDRTIMDQVVNDYCHSGIDMCDYNTINMMYQQNLKAAGEKLEW